MECSDDDGLDHRDALLMGLGMVTNGFSCFHQLRTYKLQVTTTEENFQENMKFRYYS